MIKAWPRSSVVGFLEDFKNSRRTEETLPTGFASYAAGEIQKSSSIAFKVSALRGGKLIPVGSVATFLLWSSSLPRFACIHIAFV